MSTKKIKNETQANSSHHDASSAPQQSLRECAEKNLTLYFHGLGDTPVTGVYDMVLAEIEVPLLEVVMKHTNGNQSVAAEVLGISRGTLRKKLKLYHLI
jgi:Fis family transcriptional regulator